MIMSFSRPVPSGLSRDERGVAFIEFAYALPVFVGLMLSGLELTNYVSTRMRVSQVALQLADNASRIGEGSPLAAKTLSEKQINDTLIAAGLQAGELDLYTKGRVIISNMEPMANPNPTDRYKITWQRCRGAQTHASSYGANGATNITGMGPTGRQVKAPANSATIFVEVFYRYEPLLIDNVAPNLQFIEIASMTVRDRRDLSQIHNTENVTVSSCA
jgi:TadE-like protein